MIYPIGATALQHIIQPLKQKTAGFEKLVSNPAVAY